MPALTGRLLGRHITFTVPLAQSPSFSFFPHQSTVTVVSGAGDRACSYGHADRAPGLFEVDAVGKAATSRPGKLGEALRDLGGRPEVDGERPNPGRVDDPQVSELNQLGPGGRMPAA